MRCCQVGAHHDRTRFATTRNQIERMPTVSTSTNTSTTSTTSIRSRARLRTALAAGAALAVLLSGCYRETVNVKVSPRGKVSGILQFELNTQAAKELGMTESPSDVDSKKLPAGVTVTGIRNANYEGFRYTLKNVEPQTLAYLMANLVVESEDDPAPVLVRTGDTWRFEVKSDDESMDVGQTDAVAPAADVAATTESSSSSETASSAESSTGESATGSSDESGASNSFDEANQKIKNSKAVLAKYPPRLIMSITFPGKVTQADARARVSGKTASWDITMSPDVLEGGALTDSLFAVGKAR
jgi:hypothetical protein